MTCPIESIDVSVYRVPTEGGEESDGTAVWSATTMVLVEIHGGGTTGLGYTYADAATARVVLDELQPVLLGTDALETGRRFGDIQGAIRNLGRDGITSMAISAVDVALWDLKGKILGAPVCVLLGSARESAPVYGSGGFTSYPIERLREQLAGWVADGIARVKMKVGRAPAEDPRRVAEAREAVGGATELFVDANGAYSRKQALEMAQQFSQSRVSWFEEPCLPSRL